MVRLTDALGRLPSGAVFAPVIAIVTDNDDPDELGRIRVKYPTLEGGEIESWWLRQATPNGGKDRGLYALPEKDDEVLVLFLHGDPDQGVVIGQLWNGVDLRPPEAKDGMPGAAKTELKGAKVAKGMLTDGSTDDDKNDRRFWRSRSGHLLVFDDTEGKETVQVWDKSHTLCLALDTKNSLVTLSNTKGDIEIRAKNDININVKCKGK